MTQKLYHDDAYLTQFDAQVVERLTIEGRPVIVLEQTAFYPTSGGQPYDCGTLSAPHGPSRGVLDVSLSDDAVLHWLDAPLALEVSAVHGQVDWERRFDHMQQHSGQHILSQAFDQLLNAQTLSFHLGAQAATIDLARPSLSPQDAERVEYLANAIVWQNRPVSVHVVPPQALARTPLRKPPEVSGDVRIVQVADFDWSACGGTHVAHTGEIGLIKIVKWERRGSETRVEFLCGQRALQDYAQKNAMINTVAASFNVGHWELDQAVERLQEQIKTGRVKLRETRNALLDYRVEQMLNNAPLEQGVKIIAANLKDYEPGEMREIAARLTAVSGVVALLGIADDKSQLCFARSDDVDLDVVPLLREAGEQLGGGRGGGRPSFAQGGGPAATPDQLDAVLDWAYQTVCCKGPRINNACKN